VTVGSRTLLLTIGAVAEPVEDIMIMDMKIDPSDSSNSQETIMTAEMVVEQVQTMAELGETTGRDLVRERLLEIGTTKVP
jgi:hypothetical protein